MIGDDGFAYEGRGYRFQGEITDNDSESSFDDIGLIVVFIGNFSVHQPRASQVETFDTFLRQSLEEGYISENYILLHQDQLVMSTIISKGIFDILEGRPEFHEREYNK